MILGAVVGYLLSSYSDTTSKDNVAVPEISKPQPLHSRSRNAVFETIRAFSMPEEDKTRLGDAIDEYAKEEAGRSARDVETKVSQKFGKLVEDRDKEIAVLDTEFAKVKTNYESLSKEKQQAETVLRSFAEGVIIVNSKGETLLINPAAEKLLDSKSEDLVGKSVRELAKKEGRAISLARDKKTLGGELEVLSDNEDVKRTIRASTAVIENEQGQTVGMVSVLSDIAKYQELEAQRRQFVANVTHEFRTPLATVMRSLEFLVRGEFGAINDEQKKYVEMAHRNAGRLAALVNDILDFEKFESGTFRIHPVRVKAADLVKEITLSFDAWAKGRKVTLAEVNEDAALEFDGDKDRLFQVLTNLTANALKFTPENGTVTIGARRDETFVEFRVEDTGVGISENDQRRIFEKFVQGSSLALDGGRGTGLGLAIAKEIVTLHNGRIWVASQAGKGSTFYFAIPLGHPPA